MAIWLTFAIILAIVTGLLLLTSLRTRVSASANESQAIAVYRDQLNELQRDANSGLLPQAEVHATQTEIARRILAEDQRLQKGQVAVSSRLLPILFAIAIPVIALPAYLRHGNPGVPDLPIAQRLNDAERNSDLDAMVAKVETHLAAKPQDLNGWKILAPIYAQNQRYGDAAEAYRKILMLSKPTAENLANFGEMMTLANEGMVTSRAAQAFSEALALDPRDPKARFFSALADQQEGKRDQARAKFQSLLDDSPPDASWRDAVRKSLNELAKAPALTDEQLATGKSMNAGDQEQMIRTMVDGLQAKLDADGNNIDGWLRLIRARTVLGENDKAKAALATASTIFNGKPPELAALQSLAEELRLQ